jgi:quercetin dioxygenase-like cupin family protein
MKADSLFPSIITDLPQAEISIEGLKAYLVQGSGQQVVFMCFENYVEVPEHVHEAQWGVVLDGEIKLTINDKTQIFRKGEMYCIPKDARHSAKIGAGYKDITLFNQRDRYKAKTTK